MTSGHLNIIRRAANIFDKLIVCVMVNAGKNPMFTLEERVELIKRVTGDIPNVEVDSSSELLANYAKRRGSCVIVKGSLLYRICGRFFIYVYQFFGIQI